ncbi:pilus assembly protein [Sphingomonas sp. A2-49]|uniref:TadE/TadG family type IV pilus assembly protein n=1 Tax=Sphingomonas sp. A2-49 TaxID=1391375 RepID=UPI0021D3B3DD|nr:TadE/TadG family type IV pilus assembly protein [Sphingomonas sp. A2-49]MCU6452713.1 pilus assembly protein [Sphingomonas sp. A2-49]
MIPNPRIMPRLPTHDALASDRRGSAIVQFAIISIPFFALIIAVFQITTTFLAQLALETAGDKAVRQLLTGEGQQAGTSQEQFQTLVCSKLPGLMTCRNVYIDVRNASSFAAASTARLPFTVGADGRPIQTLSFAPAPPGQITIARVMYVWSVQAGPLGLDLANLGSNRRLLTATSVFKTEPYA